MAREMFLFQSAWWNLPSWVETHWKGCGVPWAQCLFPSLSSTFHCEKHHEQHEGYRTPHSGSLGTGLVNFDPVQTYPNIFQLTWGPSIETWAGFFTFKSLTASSNFAFKSSALVCPRKGRIQVPWSSPYLVQSTSPQSPFALAASLDWRTHQMTEQSKVLLSTQQAVVPWSRVQLQMWWGMKTWLHDKTTAGQICCLETWLWTHLQYPGLSCRRNGISQTSMPEEFLPCVAPGSKMNFDIDTVSDRCIPSCGLLGCDFNVEASVSSGFLK